MVSSIVLFRDDVQNHSVTRVEVGRDSKRLGHQVLELGPQKGNVAPARGGLVPAAIITHEKKFRVAKTLFMTRYVGQIHGAVKVLNEPDEATADEDEGWSLVNNLIDTGATVKETRRILFKAHFASVYTKPKGLPCVATHAHDVEQDIWVFFQWDTKRQYVCPLADEGD